MNSRWQPRFKSRPKLSCDQNIQSEGISDQTFQTKMSFDQTEPRLLSRLYCAYGQTQTQTIVQTIKRLWSDLPDQIDRLTDSIQTKSGKMHIFSVSNLKVS